MVDVYLKGADGEQNSYTGVETVSLLSTDGETIETFVSERLIQNQVQADWTETDTSSPAYINNKPEMLPDIESEGDNGKVLGVVGGKWAMMPIPESESVEQVQVDWSENDENSVSYIKNRPFGMGEKLCELVKESTLNFDFDEPQGVYFAQSSATDEQIALWANSDWNKAYVGWGGNNIYSYEPVFTDIGKIISDECFALTIQAGQVVVVVSDSDFSSSSFYVKVAMPIIEKIDPKYLPDNFGVPESTASDADKVLTVDADGVAVWEMPASGLPEVTASDAGKFLRVNAEGAWVAETLLSAEEVAF